jgi:hypothetical protein
MEAFNDWQRVCDYCDRQRPNADFSTYYRARQVPLVVFEANLTRSKDSRLRNRHYPTDFCNDCVQLCAGCRQLFTNDRTIRNRCEQCVIQQAPAAPTVNIRNLNVANNLGSINIGTSSPTQKPPAPPQRPAIDVTSERPKLPRPSIFRRLLGRS